MTKLRWNKFIDTYSKKICFIASVSASLPKKIELDTNGRKLPSPYGLFCEWCGTHLNGDWSATKIRGGFLLCVSTKDDAKAIQDKFKIIGQSKTSLACKEIYPIGYRDADYSKLAREIGYVLKQPNKS